MISLVRGEYTDKGTRGVMVFPDGWACFTTEPPWADNEVGVSCVPEGEYPLQLRRSGVVERTTNAEYLRGWEIADVPGRTYIMIHVANYPSQLEGCVAPGQREVTHEGEPGVADSLKTFVKLMSRLEGGSSWRIRITGKT